MKLTILFSPLLLSAIFVAAQNPQSKHFAKDGLSFDYPGTWQLSDQSTGQMQLLELTSGDVVIRVRSPREWLKTPDKEAHAKKLFQENYINDFATQLDQAGLHPKRSAVTSQIAGAPAEGMSVRAILDGSPGGMDAYYRIISDRLVQLSIIASERDIAKSAPAWDLIRNSVAVEPTSQPKALPQASPAKKP
jgi:hypothetical protein